MLLNYKNEVTILYSSERRNTHFETKRNGRNDVHRLVLSCFVSHFGHSFFEICAATATISTPLNVIETHFIS